MADEMNDTRRFAKAPIIEAILDIDCDLPVGKEIAQLEGEAREVFGERYPNLRYSIVHEGQVLQRAGASEVRVSGATSLQALQFFQEDEKQLVQIRRQGFSFNRLAPYAALADYLPEIERTWRLFVDIAKPIEVRVVKLRYINLISIPLAGGNVELSEYLRTSPQLPADAGLQFRGFLNRCAAFEEETGNNADIIILANEPASDEHLPVIFDITVASAEAPESPSWDSILEKIRSLRSLKNRIFFQTLTEQCCNLFR